MTPTSPLPRLLPIPAPAPDLARNLHELVEGTRGWLASLTQAGRALSAAEIDAVIVRLQATAQRLSALAAGADATTPASLQAEVQRSLNDVASAIAVYQDMAWSTREQALQQSWYQSQAEMAATQNALAAMADSQQRLSQVMNPGYYPYRPQAPYLPPMTAPYPPPAPAPWAPWYNPLRVFGRA